MTDNAEKQPPPEKGSRGEFVRFLGVASTVGINFVVCTFVGFAIGYWLLDSYLNTFPWFTFIFLVLGIAAAFRYLFRIAAKAGKEEEPEETKK